MSDTPSMTSSARLKSRWLSGPGGGVVTRGPLNSVMGQPPDLGDVGGRRPLVVVLEHLEHEQHLGLEDAGDGADALDQEVEQGLAVAADDADGEVEAPGADADEVDLGERRDLLGRLLELVAGDADVDLRREQAEVERARGGDDLDDLALEEARDALAHARLRDPEVPGDRRVGTAPVLLQVRDDPHVDSVEAHAAHSAPFPATFYESAQRKASVSAISVDDGRPAAPAMSRGDKMRTSLRTEGRGGRSGAGRVTTVNQGGEG